MKLNANQGYNYGLTFYGEDGIPNYHFVILNTDYIEQTGCSKNVLNSDGSWSSAGNYLDPFRHGCKFLDETVTWLDNQMAAYAEDGLPIFFINHFPFVNTCPMSTYSETVIDDNSIGMQDTEIRDVLSKYDNVFTFSGHLHHALGIASILEVEGANGTFTQVNMPAIKNGTRAYANIPANWIMFVYEDEIVFRARDYSTGEWLTEFDVVVQLTKHTHEMTAHDANESTCTVAGNSAYWTCKDCGKHFSDENGETEIAENAWILPLAEHKYSSDCDVTCEACDNTTRTDAPAEHSYTNQCDAWCSVCYEQTNPDATHSLTHVDAEAGDCQTIGHIAYWTCEHCGGCWDNENATGIPLNRMSILTGYGEHDLTHIDASAATREADGNIEHWVCEHCEKYFADAQGENEIAYEDTVLVYNPESGDRAMLIPAALIALLSITGTALLAKKKQF